MATGLTKGVHEVKAVYNGGSSTKPVVGASELLRVEVGDEYAPGYKEGDLPVTEELSRTLFAIPVFPEMYDEERDYIIAQVKKALMQSKNE